MDAAIILTTIRVPKLLLGYAENFEKYGHTDVGFIIIGDRKTPDKANQQISDMLENGGFSAEYWNVSEQEEWLTEFPKLAEFVPWNSDCRRNLGYLIAYQQGAEIMITIDDDNFVTKEDYYAKHSIVGTTQTVLTGSSTNKWFNPCSLLKTDPPRNIYSRGFPYNRRHNNDVSWNHSKGKVVLNMGLWLGQPDVDAITNLNESINVTEFNSEQVMLAQGTYAPINTQNTAFHRCILPAYYYIPMGARIYGMMLDRFGDVWAGLFVKKIIDKINDRVAIGEPLSYHRRNPHDLMKDLESEIWGVLITEHLVPAIESMEIDGRTYADAYLDLAEKLCHFDCYTSRAVNKYFCKISQGMKTWVDICEKL